jgi:hypothetical protein
VKPWLSSADIEAGARPAHDLGAVLEESSFGVLCITEDNQEAPWVLFEAGALAKSVSHVVLYLVSIDPGAVNGPLTQFQMLRATKEGTWAFVRALNDSLGERERDTQTLELHFTQWWPDLERALETLPPPEPTPMQELLEYRKQQDERALREGFAVFINNDGRPHELIDVLHGDPPDQWTFLVIGPTVDLLNKFVRAEAAAVKSRKALQDAFAAMGAAEDPDTGINSPAVASAMQAASEASAAVRDAKKALSEHFRQHLPRFIRQQS